MFQATVPYSRWFSSWVCSAVLVMCLVMSREAHSATIILDPGHGGSDRGGVPRQIYSEKRLTLDVALRVRARLKASGHKVIMTRSTDTFVGLSQRVAKANRSPAGSVFVSIHFNSASNLDAHGIETYHFDQRSAALAEAIHGRVLAATKEEDRQVRRAGFYVLRHNRRTAALVELGFLTNPAEGRRIDGSIEYRERLANAVAEGIMSAVR